MSKIYYLGETKSRTGEKDKIYFDAQTNMFVCIKLDGTKRNLTLKQDKYLRNKFYTEIENINLIRHTKKMIITALILITLFCSINNKSVLKNFPKALKEYETEEKQIDDLVQKYYDSINSNPNLNEEQKDFLKKYFIKRFINDYQQEFEIQTILNSSKDIREVDVNYHNYRSLKGILGNHDEESNIINLYYPATEADPTLIHEIEHVFVELKNLSLEEGFCCAVASYCYANKSITYIEENEYLLIISKIIGKENLIHYIINNDNEQIYEDLANNTSATKKEIKTLIEKMDEHLVFEKMGKIEEAKTLDKEIKQQLFLLAIEADPENKNNFIIQNAIADDNFILCSSFLNNQYVFYNKETKEQLIVTNDTKFENEETLKIIYSIIKKATN